MKAITYLLCFSFFFIVACNGDQATKSNEGTSKATPETNLPGPKTETSESVSSNNSTTPTPEPSSPSADIDYQHLASAYCACAENTVSVNDKLAKLMESGDNAAFEAMLPEAEKAFKDAMDCCRKAKSQQSTAPVEQQELFKPLKKTCPDLPKQLMLKMVTEIK